MGAECVLEGEYIWRPINRMQLGPIGTLPVWETESSGVLIRNEKAEMGDWMDG